MRIFMKKTIILLVFLSLLGIAQAANPPIYIAFLWHMHQPIYWPGETVTQTDAAGHYSFNVTDIFRQRIGPYTTWPTDAVEAGKNAGLAHLGASVSFSGSLIENMNNLRGTVNEFSTWDSRWTQGRQWNTSLGNPRLDMIGFSYYHPINGLIDYDDIRMQIQKHKKAIADNFGSSIPYSKGYFPAETAFSPRMIPALVDEGIQWTIVDSVHFDRACKNYPWNSGGNLYEPNLSDQRNPDPNDWVQLNNLWAPTKVSAKWGHQPHYVAYTDPNTGVTKKMIAVPAERYMGNEDGRGGFGALQYDSVMSQLESYNTDTAHPIIILLHHDGDNYGGGSDSYYHSNFNSFISWLQANPSRFVATTIQDYIDMYPPDTTDVIHIEDGSWSGADNGDPEFKKWNGDPDTSGYSPDRNSWGVLMAAKNRVNTAEQISPANSTASTAHQKILEGETSCYWYWEPNPSTWDGHVTRASNQAVSFVDSIIGSGSADSTPPTIYMPQREPYNPGGKEWSINQSTTFTVWSYVYDLSGLSSVNLKYRTDNDNVFSSDNDTYAGGAGVSAWNTVAMSSTWRTPQTTDTPTYKAWEYSTVISGMTSKTYDYYVEATDTKGKTSRSPIRHVTLGVSQTGGGGSTTGPSCFWTPSNPTTGQTIKIYYDPINGSLPDATNPAYIHLGINRWGTIITPDIAMTFDSTTNYFRYDYPIPSTASTVDFVFNNGSGTWDNNAGSDWHVVVSGSVSTNTTSVSTNTTAVWWSPLVPTVGSTLNVYYDPVPGSLPDATTPIYIHLGYNRWNSVVSPDTVMTYDSSTHYWKYSFTVPLSAKTVDFVFNNGGGTWDNNQGADWHLATQGVVTTVPVEYTLDGSLDTVAQLIAVSSNSTLHLWAHWNGTKLYLATEKGASGQDRFLLLTRSLTSTAPAIWAKAGQVAQWDAFIGNEESNSWNGWFNSTGQNTTWSFAQVYVGAGTYLEATMQLTSLYGTLPSGVYLAVLGYATGDGGALQNQAPAGNANGNLETNELVLFNIPSSLDDWMLMY